MFQLAVGEVDDFVLVFGDMSSAICELLPVSAFPAAVTAHPAIIL